MEASRALARLDADRLEELALSCQALNRDLAGERDRAHGSAAERAALALEAKDTVREMAVFARVLEATRANLNVMNRLRELRAARLEYPAGQLEYGQAGIERRAGCLESGAPQLPGWRRTEIRHGDN